MKTLFTKPIVIQLKPSLSLLGLLLTVATVSCLILLIVTMSVAIKLILLALIMILSAYYIARDALLILPSSWQVVEVDTKGVLSVVNKRQQRFKPQLAATTFVHEYCVILNVKYQGIKLGLPPILLFKHVENADAHRRLRVWLRLLENKPSKQINQQTTQLTTTD